MVTTHLSLIVGLRDQAPQAWERFNRIYRSWLLDWVMHRFGFQAEDAEDVVQQVLTDLHQEFHKQRTGERPAFQHNGRAGAFRSWLRLVLHHRALAFLRSRRLRPAVGNADELLEQLSDPHSALSDLWNQQHEQRVIHQAWDTVMSEFAPNVWRPVGEVLFKERRSREVADEFRIPLRTLYSHQKLIKDRLRELLDGMID